MVMLLILLSVWQGRFETVERVDVIELNHFYECGQHRFDQVIFWSWSPDLLRLDCVAWKMANDVDLCLRPVSATWLEQSRRRRVNAKLFRETWTSFDPERAAVKLTAVEHRLRLLPE